jgi:hypothetical protein
MHRPVILGVLLAGCGADIDQGTADALWTEIHALEYRSFRRAPGYDEPRPTIRAHGDTALVFLDPTIASAADGSQALTEWPEGSLLVKDSYSGSELQLIAAMQKRARGWVFVEWDAEGDAKYAGQPEVCVNCHQAGGDFVLSVALPGGQ